jgi:hypothetical protein
MYALLLPTARKVTVILGQLHLPCGQPFPTIKALCQLPLDQFCGSANNTRNRAERLT